MKANVGSIDRILRGAAGLGLAWLARRRLGGGCCALS